MAVPKTPKALLISQLVDQLKTALPVVADLPRLDLVESVIFAILRENRSSSEALTSLAAFKADYDDDFNELRVSSLREITRKLAPSPDAEARAKAIRRFLHQIFDKNYKFQIDGLAKKPFKEARDDLKDYEILSNDHHMAYVQVQCLGGHAFPVDSHILEMARRLGIVDKSADAATLRGLLEKNIPKAQILQSISLIEKFVNEICTAVEPRCQECLFQKICPFNLGLLQPSKPSKPEKSSASPKSKGAEAETVESKDAAKPAKPGKDKTDSSGAAPKASAAKASAKASPSSAPTAQKASIPASGSDEQAKPVKTAAKAAVKPKESPAVELTSKPAPEKSAAKSSSSAPKKSKKS
jgi:endonuclease III